MTRDILGFILATAFGTWILSFVVSGLRTGRIHHTDSTSTFTLRRQSARFILVAMLFTLFAALFFYAGIGRAISIWHRLSG